MLILRFTVIVPIVTIGLIVSIAWASLGHAVAVGWKKTGNLPERGPAGKGEHRALRIAGLARWPSAWDRKRPLK